MRQRTRVACRPRRAADHGFTLIELLVVVVIIGILIAIAIPVYLNYQKGAKDKSAASDLRNAVGVLEQCNSDNGAYPTASFTLTASGVAGTCTQSINVTSGSSVVYAYTAGTNGAASIYVATSFNTGGSPKVYCYNSAVGGSVKSVTNSGTAAAPAGTC